MKRIFVVLAGLTLMACSKHNSTPLPSATYPLYNYSNGAAQQAGTFVIAERSDSNAMLTIQLDKGYLSSGTTFTASIVTMDDSASVLVYSVLQPVNGGNGSSVTNPVIASGTSTPVAYRTLIGLTGYSVQVLNGANIQAKGVIN